MLNAGFGQLPSAVLAILFSTACGGLFGLLALRAFGIGFLMITLALGQIVWGIAYRANTLTEGVVRTVRGQRRLGADWMHPCGRWWRPGT